MSKVWPETRQAHSLIRVTWPDACCSEICQCWPFFHGSGWQWAFIPKKNYTFQHCR